MKFFLQLFINAVAIFLTAYLFPNSVILVGFASALVVAVILAFLNFFLKPVLLLFSIPVNFVTFGLFTLVINAAIIMIASYFARGFQVDGFLTAFLFSIVLSITSSILQAFFGMKNENA